MKSCGFSAKTNDPAGLSLIKNKKNKSAQVIKENLDPVYLEPTFRPITVFLGTFSLCKVAKNTC